MPLLSASLSALIDASTLSVHGRRSAFQPPSRPRSNFAQEDRQTVRGYSGNFFSEFALPQCAPTDCEKIVVTGDFFQLPPVTQGGKDVFFAFQSDAWKESIERTVTLTQVFRQKDSGKSAAQRREIMQCIRVLTHHVRTADFVSLLNELRRGEISAATQRILTGLSRPLSQDDGILPTQLFPLRTEVDRANASRLAALGGPAHTFVALDSGSAEQGKRQRLLENMMAVRTLELKRDAQVMLVKNVSDTLVNGSVGKVLNFCLPPEIKNNKKKSQDGGDGHELLPLVEFSTFRGKETLLVSRDEFRAEDSEGKLLARRVQVWQIPASIDSLSLSRSCHR